MNFQVCDLIMYRYDESVELPCRFTETDPEVHKITIDSSAPMFVHCVDEDTNTVYAYDFGGWSYEITRPEDFIHVKVVPCDESKGLIAGRYYKTNRTVHTKVSASAPDPCIPKGDIVFVTADEAAKLDRYLCRSFETCSIHFVSSKDVDAFDEVEIKVKKKAGIPDADRVN